MPKLHLKRTPEEEAQHKLQKEARREAKRKRKYPLYDTDDAPSATSSSRKRHHPDIAGEGETSRKWASSDEDMEEDEYGPQPAGYDAPGSSSGYKPDYEAIRAELEEQRFREKMFDALGEDERLDSVEAKLNDFAHVPDRWRTAGGGSKGKRRAYGEEGDDLLKLDPSTMDEEEYAEWIRRGMYRKTHAEEYEEQQRKKAAAAARKAEEKERRAETKRLEKEAEEERKIKKRERESRKWDYAREEYHLRWKALLTLSGSEDTTELLFEDIPWPIVDAHRQKPEKKRLSKRGEERTLPPRISIDDLTAEAISAFILPIVSASVTGQEGEEEKKKGRKEKLREAFLRFHPDKFEGRFMKRVREGDRKRVREAIGQVSRVLNGLMGEGG
ncbi:hypothetical protein BDQ12DRAFT_673780 [Crucibulum laeve]|uniref:Uncharacterized protein n=1 Tax=Crucibulum laeve TaxID=68775 RepID=A0A5C3MHK5_9AGAR|nr:hypothetical protein BDQ12DRAFT_673780 [Crucibulum laeve]